MDGDIRQWREQGYLVVRGVFTADRVARLRPVLEHVRERFLVRDPVTGAPGAADISLSQPHHPGYFADRPAWRDEVLDAGSTAEVRDLARRVFAEEPLFRALGFWFNPPTGRRDGSWHRDSQFLQPDEASELASIRAQAGGPGDALQFQIALVANDDLELVPGSHLRWDTAEEYAIRRADGGIHSLSNAMPGALRIALAAGDGVIFNPMGLHRGRYHADKPRRTFMCTYTRTSAPMRDGFSRQPWFLEPGYLAGLAEDPRAFYRRFAAVYGPWWRGEVEAAEPVRSGA
jgi:hypothetical protein